MVPLLSSEQLPTPRMNSWLAAALSISGSRSAIVLNWSLPKPVASNEIVTIFFLRPLVYSSSGGWPFVPQFV